MKRYLLLLYFGLGLITTSPAAEIITLTWQDVVPLGLKRNLEIQMLQQDVKNQQMNVYRSLGDFLPTVQYTFQAVNNIELPVMVFMGRSFRIGTKYNFTHGIQIQYPIFLGGARLANYTIQKQAKRSLQQLLKGKKDEIVLKAIGAYFSVMLNRELVRVNQKAQMAARANLAQVKKFFQVGAASQLDVLRAKTRFSQTIPALSSALNNLKLSLENLKFVLNLPPEDSLLVLDSLTVKDFLRDLRHLSLNDLQTIALQSRSDVKNLEHQLKIAQSKKWLAGSHFLPQVVLTASLQQQAFLETAHVTSKDYTRSKAAGLSFQWPLFEGGKRVVELQQAYIQKQKMEQQKALLERSIRLEVTNTFNQFQLAKQNLNALKQAFEEAQETWRLAQLSYQEGVTTQVDVLNAQMILTEAETQFRKGIFEYNMAQLNLLKALGKLDLLWQPKHF